MMSIAALSDDRNFDLLGESDHGEDALLLCTEEEEIRLFPSKDEDDLSVSELDVTLLDCDILKSLDKILEADAVVKDKKKEVSVESSPRLSAVVSVESSPRLSAVPEKVRQLPSTSQTCAKDKSKTDAVPPSQTRPAPTHSGMKSGKEISVKRNAIREKESASADSAKITSGSHDSESNLFFIDPAPSQTGVPAGDLRLFLNSQRRKRLKNEGVPDALDNPPSSSGESQYANSHTKFPRIVVQSNHSKPVPTLPATGCAYMYSPGISGSLFPAMQDGIQLYQRHGAHSSASSQFSLQHLFEKQPTVKFSLNHL